MWSNDGLVLSTYMHHLASMSSQIGKSLTMLTEGSPMIIHTAHVIIMYMGDIVGFYYHITQGFFTGTGAIIWLPKNQWRKSVNGLDEYTSNWLYNQTKTKHNQTMGISCWIYCQTSNISCTLAVYKLVDHSDVVAASPVGAAPTTSSFST